MSIREKLGARTKALQAKIKRHDEAVHELLAELEAPNAAVLKRIYDDLGPTPPDDC